MTNKVKKIKTKYYYRGTRLDNCKLVKNPKNEYPYAKFYACDDCQEKMGLRGTGDITDTNELQHTCSVAGCTAAGNMIKVIIDTITVVTE